MRHGRCGNRAGTVPPLPSLTLKIESRVTVHSRRIPSGSAFRPSDVLTIYGGKTVENAILTRGSIVWPTLWHGRRGSSRLGGHVGHPHRRLCGCSRTPSAGLMATDATPTCFSMLRGSWRGHLAATDPRGIRSKLAPRSPTAFHGHERWRGALIAAAFLRDYRGGRHRMGTSRHCPQRFRTAAVRICSPGGPGRRAHPHRLARSREA